MSGIVAQPVGITSPPIDDLLEHVDSKYALVIFAAKRARQINSYNLQLQQNMIQFVGPVVDVQPEEKPREYYTKALELIGDNSDYVSQKQVALRYLAFYYLKKNEDATCLKYVDQLLKLDPKDSFALKLKSVLK